MFNIAIFEPQIPQNTGNIIRLCANTGAYLHLIHPLGFQLNDKKLIRAGLDYKKLIQIEEHKNFDSFIKKFPNSNIYAIETCGEKIYTETKFLKKDILIFGSETRGLPNRILTQISKDNILKIPMLPNNRSLNLSNSVSIVLYEAWRQNGFLKK